MWDTFPVLINLACILLNSHAQVNFPQDIVQEGQFDQSNVICISNLFTNNALGSPNGNGLFGVSVKLVTNDLLGGAASSSWIFVGDPKGNSTDPSYRSGRRSINEPGVVWRCSLGQAARESCQIMHLDPDLSDTRSQQVCTPSRGCPDVPFNEQRDISWVGGVIESNRDRFLTCGHRRTTGRPDDPSIQGICYWFNKETMSSWDPSSNDLNIDLARYNHRLFPLYQNPAINQLFYLPTTKGSLVDWSFGQAGMSLHLSNDNELLVGAPGVRLWTGSVIIYHDSDVRDPRVSRDRLNNFREKEFAKFTVTKRENQAITGRHYYDYFGYAVTSGNYFAGGGNKVYVAGAPRARDGSGGRGRALMGQVVMFRLPFLSPVSSRSSEEPIVEITNGIFSGEQFGSYFGSTLLSADVTNDGFDELFVGAPFYITEFNTVRGKREDNKRVRRQADSTFQTYSRFGDQGVVYVYSYGRNGRKATSHLLYGSNSPGARFGSAMVSLGDINEDTFIDVAIGAPYENDGEGAVYIFYGQSNLNNWKWNEKISPSKYEGLFTPQIHFQGFGTSLSSDIDIDGNSTPDLSIGSYLSQQVVILRTRPIIKIEGRIQIIGQNGRPIQTVPITVTNLRIESCVRFSGLHAGQNLPMEVTIRVDPRFGIVQQAAERSGSQRVKVYDESVSRDYKCTIFQADVNKIIEAEESQATVPSIRIEQFVLYKGIQASTNQFYHYKIQKGRSDLPTLDYSSTGPINFQQFCPTCPFPTKGETTMALQIASECEDPSNCKPELKIESWFTVDGKKVKSMILDWSERITLHFTVANSGEPAYGPILAITWENPSEKEYKPRIYSKSSDCAEDLICNLGKSIKSNKQSKTLEIEFDLTGMYASMSNHVLNAELNCYIGNNDRSIATSKLTLSLKSELRPILTAAQSQGIGFTNPFSQQYIVNIEGPTFPSAVLLAFKFPVFQTHEGQEKEILLVAPPNENYNCTEEQGTGHFTDSVKFISTKDTMRPTGPFNESARGVLSRQRRETTEMNRSGQNKNKDTTSLVFSCDDPGIKCMTVKCLISKPSKRTNPVTFVMSLTRNTTAHLQESINSILIKSIGVVQVFDGSSSDATAETVIVKSSSSVGPAEEVPLWIYIVGGVGGFIILAFIVAILYWNGFFKRDKKEQLEQLKVQAGIQDHLLSANQRAPSFQDSPRTDAFE